MNYWTQEKIVKLTECYPLLSPKEFQSLLLQWIKLYAV